MNRFSDTYLTRTYYKRLLLSFLCISIIPLAMCVIAILYANYQMSMDRYTTKGEAISDDYTVKLEAAILEYENIADSIAGNAEIADLLKANAADQYQPVAAALIASMQTGRENRIKIHILDADSKLFVNSAQQLPTIYHPDIFAEWGMLYQLSQPLDQALFLSTPYVDEDGRAISACLGQAIRDTQGGLLGYVLIDIYRDTLSSLLTAPEEEGQNVMLCDRDRVVVLDTADPGREGRLAAVSGQAEETSFHRAIFNPQRNTHIKTSENSQTYAFALSTYLNISDFYAALDLLIMISFVLFCITVFFCQGAAALLAKRLYEPVVEETKRQKDAEIEALQAQISPHFLYNMLNEIKALSKLGRTAEIADFVVHLGRLLRRSITYQEAFVEVRDELAFIEDYLALQQIRYERCFAIEIDVEAAVLNCRMPKLILQPIVENSIVHGFADSKKHHLLRIEGRVIDQKYLRFEIYDDGVGVDQDYIQYINNVEKGSGIYGGLGVENVQKRLLLTYGMEYGLQIDSMLSEYTRVTVLLPFEKGGGYET